ncbi:caspase-4-like [Acomys russatus]|uniref:caspase-4-like n=1 Tax=Acomys russatus TaxID=60746 RepID=UPI0021E1ED00|nr:caspase-4-like [Acomys russatus]
MHSNFRFTVRNCLPCVKELKLFVMAENNRPVKPLKMLENLGKEVLTEYLEKLVQSDVLKLKEDEKEKFNNAERKNKRWVFVDALRQTFLNVDTRRQHGEDDPEMEEPEESTETLNLCPPEEFMRVCTEKTQDIYPIMEAKGRTRKALIICNTEFKHLAQRRGADFDIIGMTGLLEGLGYTVVLKKELTAEGMEAEMRDFAALSDHKTSDSTFLVLMSHGTLHGICGTMHSENTPDVLQYDTIYQIFNNRHCPGLRDKPKVIIVQACRGGNPGEVWIRQPSKAQSQEAIDLPRKVVADAVQLRHMETNFVAFYSTTPHHLSYIDETRGSYFITKLITCFQTYSCSCHLLDIFQKVQQSFVKPSIVSQMPTIERATLTRHFYLFPGN